MENKSDILFDEIRQLIEQYKAEVPGRRHAWPVSIKSRVLDLCNTEGMRLKEVASGTGLPYHTVLNWRFQNKKQESVGAFRAVTVTPSRAALVEASPVTTVTVKRRRQRVKSTSTLTVTVPSGVRIEGLDVAGALRIIERFGRGNSI